MQKLILLVGVSFLFFVFNQLILNYANEKRNSFMKHKIWNRMFIILLTLLGISFVIFITIFFLTPLEGFISSQPWTLFIVVFYFLFLFNAVVLSIVHKIGKEPIPVEKKLFITWAGSTMLFALVFFVLPIY